MERKENINQTEGANMAKAITTHKGVTLYEDGTAKITNDNEAMSAILDILAEKFNTTRQQAAELWKDMQATNTKGREMKRGDKVICNGYEGRIIEVLEGQLKGMVEVRLQSGDVCVDGCTIRLI